MKTQLHKFKMLTVLLALVGMLLSASVFAAPINVSGTVSKSGAPAGTLSSVTGLTVTAVSQTVPAHSYSTATNASGVYSFTGLPLAAGEKYTIMCTQSLFHRSFVIDVNTSSTVNLSLTFNYSGFKGGNGGFPLYEQFVSSATIDGADLSATEGNEIGIFDGIKCVGVIILDGGLVTGNVFDAKNKLIAYSTLAAETGIPFPAGYGFGNPYSYKLYQSGILFTNTLNVAHYNIDGVCYMDAANFPGSGLYVHGVTGFQFNTGSLYKISGKVKDAFKNTDINGATVSVGSYTGITAGSGDYETTSIFPDGTYTMTVSKTGYVTKTASAGPVSGGNLTYNVLLTPTGALTGHIVLEGTGDGISGVSVTATDGAGHSGGTTTDMYGGYTISGLSDGTYSLSASKTGYTPTCCVSGIVLNGGTTTVVSMKLKYYSGHFPAFLSDPNDTWTIYLAQAKIGSNDMLPGDEIAIYDITGGDKLCGIYAVTQVLTPGAAYSHDMVAFRYVAGGVMNAGNGFTAGDAYTFRAWQKSTNTEFYLGSFTITTPPSTWSSKTACPAANNLFSVVTLNFLDHDPSGFMQSICLKPGINWVSSYIQHSPNTFANIITDQIGLTTLPSAPTGTGSSNTQSFLQSIKNSGGLDYKVTSTGPVVWTDGITGGWKNEEGYIFTMNDVGTYTPTLTITGNRVDPVTTQIPVDNSSNLSADWFMVGNLLSSPVNASIAFGDLLTGAGGTLTGTVTYIKNQSGRMFWNIAGIGLVNNIGDLIPGEAYQFFVPASSNASFYYNSSKSGNLVSENYSTSHFVIGGNAADNVFTIYIKTSDFAAGDEIGAFDGDKLVGATKLISRTGTFDNAIPAFKTISTGDGYQVGHPITLRAWSSFENKEYAVSFTLDNSNGAYYNTVYPDGDGRFCIATITKSAMGINDISSIVANIYPNPAKDYVNVVADRTIDKISLMNMMGQTVAEKTVNDSSTKMNLNGILPGVYFLKIECNGQFSTKKVVVQ